MITHRVRQKIHGRVELPHIATIQHQDTIRVDDGVQPVRDGERRPVPELLPNGFLVVPWYHAKDSIERKVTERTGTHRQDAAKWPGLATAPRLSITGP